MAFSFFLCAQLLVAMAKENKQVCGNEKPLAELKNYWARCLQHNFLMN
jgi:hypothetical protein